MLLIIVEQVTIGGTPETRHDSKCHYITSLSLPEFVRHLNADTKRVMDDFAHVGMRGWNTILSVYDMGDVALDAIAGMESRYFSSTFMADDGKMYHLDTWAEMIRETKQDEDE